MESLIEFNNIKQQLLPKIQTVKVPTQPETQKPRSHSLPQLKSIFQQSLIVDRPNLHNTNNLYLCEYV